MNGAVQYTGSDSLEDGSNALPVEGSQEAMTAGIDSLYKRWLARHESGMNRRLSESLSDG